MHTELLIILFALSANLYCMDINQELISAVKSNSLEKVKELISAGANINAKYNLDSTLLHWAVARNFKDIVELLVKNGANINAQESEGRTPLLWATYNGNKDILELLISHGADINAKDKYEFTPLHKAAYDGNKELAKLLLDNKANILASQNMRAIASATAGATPDMVNDIDEDGFTSLHHAVAEGHKEIIELLLEHGINKNGKDNAGRTAVVIAEQLAYLDIKETIDNYVAVVKR